MKNGSCLVPWAHVGFGASGGVSVRAGPSPELKSRRVRARRERARGQVEDEAVRATGALLCSECGRLTWPELGSESPHRSSGEAPHRAQCPHCQSRAWIDLRRESTALAIGQGELDLAAADSPLVDSLRKAGLGIVVGSFIGLVATNSLVLGGSIAALAGLAGGLAAVRLRRMSVPAKRTLPDRWSLALPPAAPTTGTVEGVAQDAELLRSPLTGRSCVAFEVGLRQDRNVTGEMSSWALLEQRVAPMSVGGATVNPGRTFVEVSRERLGELTAEVLGAAAVEWFLERGFSAIGSNMTVFESVLLPEGRLSLTQSPDGCVLRRASGALERPVDGTTQAQ